MSQEAFAKRPWPPAVLMDPEGLLKELSPRWLEGMDFEQAKLGTSLLQALCGIIANMAGQGGDEAREAELWLQDLEKTAQSRTPNERFVVLRISILNVVVHHISEQAFELAKFVHSGQTSAQDAAPLALEFEKNVEECRQEVSLLNLPEATQALTAELRETQLDVKYINNPTSVPGSLRLRTFIRDSRMPN